MKANLTVKVDKLNALVKSINGLTGRQVLVGVPESRADRDSDPEEKGPINNATLAYIHETGSPAANIPARPFLVPGIEENADAIAKRMKKAVDLATSGKNSKVDAALEAVGMTAMTAVQDKITNGDFAPLSPRTLAARKRRGRDTETAKPLIDTGQLRRSINYVVTD